MSSQQQYHQAMNSAMNAQTPAVSIRQQLLSGTLCIKYTISEDMTKGEQARNKARLSAIADQPRILGSKRSSVLGFTYGRTGIEAHRNHGTLLLKDRSGFSVPFREVLQKSVTSDTNRPLNKKGQRFFCTMFPPCQLSFTRSEHLARHIQKHAGEQPFQCHCSRRFSRLDNLRQHAQTAHVNEDIPGDSLAATGTRYQRQIRIDQVRPLNSRSRANILGSQGGHSREDRPTVGGGNDLYHCRSVQMLVNRNSPVSFHANQGSLSSASSLSQRTGPFASSYGLSAASSATSYSSEPRLSPGALSPSTETEFGPVSPYAASRSLNPSPRGSLSASSITSITSSVSVSVTQPQDSRRHPPPFAMANDGTARTRVSPHTYNPPLMGSPGPSYQTYGNQSPSGIMTPTLATFSTGTGSPRFPSGLQLPISTMPRSLPWGSRTPGRRLSVPSGANPSQGPQGSSTFPPLYI